MKLALSHNGERLEASPAAPEEAFCPHCGDPVLLRSRRTMVQGVTFYWRHANNRGRNCQGRSNPIGWKNTAW